MPTFIQLKNGTAGIWIQAWPTPGAMGVGTEPAQRERGGVAGSNICRLQTPHFCPRLALLQSETSTGKLNKGKKSQTEQIPI